MNIWTRRLIFVLGLLLVPMLSLAAENDLTGIWNGTYYYMQNSQRRPVQFAIVLIQSPAGLTGLIREANTLGKPNDRWLHATLKGQLGGSSNQLSFTKTYDGTASVGHDVEYRGVLSGGGTSVSNGTWRIGNEASGQFTLQKDPSTGPGPLSGHWTGSYSYANSAQQAPVQFTLLMVRSGPGLAGFVKEANTFGQANDPWLHATIKGHFNANNRQLSFSKTYDGTANVGHDVTYRGSVSKEGPMSVVNGSWEIKNELSGTFSLYPDIASLPEISVPKVEGTNLAASLEKPKSVDDILKQLEARGVK
jgi:hypothetical protein